jgi:hypothetical protein
LGTDLRWLFSNQAFKEPVKNWRLAIAFILDLWFLLVQRHAAEERRRLKRSSDKIRKIYAYCNRPSENRP